MVADVQQRTVAQVFFKVDGAPVADGLNTDIVRLVVESSVHLPDVATLTVHDLDFRWSRQDVFKAGQELRIELGERDLKREVFVGEITCIEEDMPLSGKTLLVVTAYDRAHRLHRGRFTRTFAQMKDSDIASKIAQELSFTADVEQTSEVHEYVLQDNQTNWEFLQERATRLGFELVVADRKLLFKPPPSVPADQIKLRWRSELLSFRARLATGEQVNEVEVRGWDPLNKKEVVGRATTPAHTPSVGETRTGGAAAQAAFQAQARMVVAREPVYTVGQANKLAQAVLDDLGNTFITAEGTAMGNPKLRLGSEVAVEDVPPKFAGTYFATEIRHVYEPEGYRIEFRATGRRSTDVAALLTPQAAPRMHVLPGIVSNNKDPRDVGRVKVKLPVLGPDIETSWCRVVATGAGKDRGMEYLPEIDDEVLLLGSDMHNLFVLGGLWNANDLPPEKSSAAVGGSGVNKRIIRSRTGHIIVIDDSDDGGGISIVDSAGKNRVVISTKDKSLELAAEGDIKIDAGGSLQISSGMDTKMKAGTDLKAEAGSNASVEASIQLSLSGNIASLKGNAMTEVKAPTVNVGQ